MEHYATDSNKVPTAPRRTIQDPTLPEIVDFRITGDKRKAIFFIREGDVFYRKHLDLSKPGAGLQRVMLTCGHVHFAREQRTVDRGAFLLTQNVGVMAFTCTRDIAQALAFIFWGKELDLSDWPEAEGVQPAQPETLAEAAD